MTTLTIEQKEQIKKELVVVQELLSIYSYFKHLYDTVVKVYYKQSSFHIYNKHKSLTN